MLEAVPNVSEGRDAAVVDAICSAFATRARVLDVHSDVDHHRSVFTLAGEPDALVDALLDGAEAALSRIDLREHEGAHPRVGVVDVAPLVPIAPVDMPLAEEAARALVRRLGDAGVTVFAYGRIGCGRRPAFYRAGGLERLIERVEQGELAPAAGPARIDPRRGVVLVGARPPLVAYNVELATADVAPAREIARAVRESSGGLPGVQAIGLALPRTGRVQVSMNVLDLERSPLHVVVAEVERLAAERGVAVVGGELVGLVPARVLEAAREAGIEVPDVDETRVLERAL